MRHGMFWRTLWMVSWDETRSLIREHKYLKQAGWRPGAETARGQSRALADQTESSAGPARRKRCPRHVSRPRRSLSGCGPACDA
eukprot:1684890-Rhodomonas_salina.2